MATSKTDSLKSVSWFQDKLMKGFWTIPISRRRAKNVLISSFLTSSHCLTNLWDTRLGLALRYWASYRLVFSTIISISSSVIKNLGTSKAWRPSRSLTYTPRWVVNSATIGQMSNLGQVFSKSFFSCSLNFFAQPGSPIPYSTPCSYIWSLSNLSLTLLWRLQRFFLFCFSFFFIWFFSCFCVIWFGFLWGTGRSGFFIRTLWIIRMIISSYLLYCLFYQHCWKELCTTRFQLVICMTCI